MARYDAVYQYDGIKYNVHEFDKIHSLLESDNEFAVRWFEENIPNLEVVGVADTENLLESSTESKKDKTSLFVHKFKWEVQSTLLLLNCYLERKEEFRTPSIKKSTLWQAIADIFKKNSYSIDADQLDIKFRNLKKTFVQVLDNNKSNKTGRGTVTWQYFTIFQEIFNNSKSVVLDRNLITGSSLAGNILNHSTSSIDSSHLLSSQPSSSSSSLQTLLKRSLESSHVLSSQPSCGSSSLRNSLKRSSDVLSGCEDNASEVAGLPPQKSSLEKKRNRWKKLENQRNEHQRIEKEKLECIKSLVKSVNENTKNTTVVASELIERNKLLREFIDEYKKKHN